MAAEAPGEQLASRAAMLRDSSVAEAGIFERTAAFGERLREAYTRLHRGGAWTPWRRLAGDAHDISITADLGQEEQPTALVSVLIWVRAPAGAVVAHHVAHRTLYFRMTASGVAAAADLGTATGNQW